jgi:DNA uptake protein ComE-like DNA-binding protein
MWRPSTKQCNLSAGILALAIMSPACGVPEESDTLDGAFSQPLSSAEEQGVLRFVNDCPTTLSVLDDDAALDARAAAGIVKLRDGGDVTCGTPDDRWFATMAELDAVPWVGDVALSKLVAHATLLGYVSDGNDGLAPAYDGVPFTLEEAHGVLAIANGASLEILDIDFGLDARAASAIIAARPFAAATTGARMEQLAAASYVGTSALQRLKAFATPWQACTTASATVKGTLFSSLEAHDTLDMLNQAPVGVLTSITGIGSVIAGRIDGARPFESLAQLAAVDGVGPSVAGHLHEEIGTRWCPLLGARCGCAPDVSYRPPFVAFDENGLYYFLAYGEERWEGERAVDSGFLSHDGDQVVLTGVQVPDDPDHWQDITVQVFDRLWDCCLRHQYVGEPLEIGRNRRGVLYLGRVLDAHDGKAYVLAYWRDIDDASFGWLYEKDAAGRWVQKGEVFLN